MVPGSTFTDAGAAHILSSRSLLSSGKHLVWHKGHPERSDTPLPPGPVRGHLSRTASPSDRISARSRTRQFLHSGSIRSRSRTSWGRCPPRGLANCPASSPPLGNLRSTLSHHRALAYRANRDTFRWLRGAAGPSALPGKARRTRTTDDRGSSAPVPWRTTLVASQGLQQCTTGGATACADVSALLALLVCRICLLAFMHSNP